MNSDTKEKLINIGICAGLWLATIILSAFPIWIVELTNVETDSVGTSSVLLIVFQCAVALIMVIKKRKRMTFPLVSLYLNGILGIITSISAINLFNSSMSELPSDAEGFSDLLNFFGTVGSILIVAVIIIGIVIEIVISFVLTTITAQVTGKIIDKKAAKKIEQI